MLPIDFDRKNAPLTLSHGEGRWGKNLRTTINEGIVTKKLTKKHPTHLSYLRGWLGQWIIISKILYFTFININMKYNTFIWQWNKTSIILLQHWTQGYIFLFYHQMVFCKSTSILSTSIVDTLPTSTLVCICSWIISIGTNVTKFSL